MEMNRQLIELTERYPKLTAIQDQIQIAYERMKACYLRGGKILFAGNGGSSADAEHIVGELMKGFVKKRSVPEEIKAKMCAIDETVGQQLGNYLQGALPAISLSGHPALSSAFLNDVNGDYVLAQQTYGYGRAGDILFAISTSGNAKNIEYACIVAKAAGMEVIGLTGKDGGVLAKLADTAMIMPEQETYKIQELHLPVYHALCLMLEDFFFES